MTLVDPKVRFESRFYKEEDPNGYSGTHWVWKSSGKSYPTFCLGGKNMPARLASWILHRGPLVANQKLGRIFYCHRYACVNPDHLEVKFKLEVEPWAGPDGRWHSPGPGRPRGSKKLQPSPPPDDLPPLLPEEIAEDLRHERIAERASIVAARRRGEAKI